MVVGFGSGSGLVAAGPFSNGLAFLAVRRVQSLDRARGLAIFAIVLGHVWLSSEVVPLHPFVYAFHVPLFFYLSGLFFRVGGPGQWTRLARRVRTIAIPYAVWAVISVAVFVLLGELAAQTLQRRQPARNPLVFVRGILFANPSNGGMDWNTPLWFLPAIVVAYVLAAVVLHLLRPLGRGALPVALIASSALSPWVATQDWTLPMSIERTLVLLPFFLLGMLSRSVVVRIEDVRGVVAKGVAVVIAGACFWGVWVIGHGNGVVEYVVKAYGNSFAVFVVGALLGVVGTLAAAVVLPFEFLAMAGRDSLAVLVMHKFFVVAVQILAIRLMLGERWGTTPVVILGAALATAASLALRPVVQRIWPPLVGRTARPGARPAVDIRPPVS